MIEGLEVHHVRNDRRERYRVEERMERLGWLEVVCKNDHWSVLSPQWSHCRRNCRHHKHFRISQAIVEQGQVVFFDVFIYFPEKP